ncbi:hypothetical protein DPMN_140749 [Dreissena polymorpha]|uniref:Uncharacterized protein n=1 Tax=Dreissena polymorpha TaxID=45954 RepID=A0A9D4G868_DREPO|nr:hypothetical protein DPMN_140749 [Dreissena polymorpha]
MALCTSNVESGSYREERKVDFNEILPVRKLLRKEEYVLHPMNQKVHRILDGDIQLTVS